MAYQAIGHIRKRRMTDSLALFESPMTGPARVLSIKVPAYIARRRQVSLAIDSVRDHLRDVPKLQMLGVTELRNGSVLRLVYGHPLRMAFHANRSRRAQIVSDLRTRSDSRMAIRALRHHLQVELMRKRRIGGHGATR
jgi:hypothetical protein